MDRSRNKTCGWVIDDRTYKTLKKLFEKIKSKGIKAYYTDDWEVYKKVLPKSKHKIGKKYTIKIEQNNSNVRHYLMRMTRRTKVVSKSKEMVDLSLRLCWFLNEDNGFNLFQRQFISIFS